MPVNIVPASQFKSHVHCSLNVNLPLEIEWQLSVGMNYMFKRKHNTKLIKNVWRKTLMLNILLHWTFEHKGSLWSWFWGATHNIPEDEGKVVLPWLGSAFFRLFRYRECSNWCNGAKNGN
jgi:hypothetical protein